MGGVRDARFLPAVVEGMALARIVPVGRPSASEEQGVLDDALSVVFRDAPAGLLDADR